MNVKIAPSWKTSLAEEFEKPYFQTLAQFVRNEYKTQVVYPPAKLMFNAFEQCAFETVNVVILGQDPYHGEKQAHGLCFSVNDGITIPPSLINIFKEIQQDLGQPFPQNGNLERWAKQGVLLLNAILTVRANQAASHRNQGWEQFTDAVIQRLAQQRENIVFLLWGKYAQDKGKIIDRKKHLVLTSAHPSPLSARNFFGNHHFSQANDYLVRVGKTPIIW
ncbi:uracil-DNA glycosylase [Beggiatoa leptomitoformis]|uniref:Uracil-DNA glycosylase n=1 Tax=Beggiatoa leptomitoformis TaxID=288004 RepID=A0A2N9YF40_9GAMM|nr:uracil-DNA glycosylase [Beggiatoa leptomitoformis]ALG68571.1 uracil-DNA glycosylase [Beggiatoa leptomitoformis]AUI69084.1 uracil-DNA glycosylase [Beggiatoa leptomitoformis]